MRRIVWKDAILDCVAGSEVRSGESEVRKLYSRSAAMKSKLVEQARTSGTYINARLRHVKVRQKLHFKR